ncbi:hypothetical protein B0H14DRAFT_3482370 [Mycena olivaceomarginata]|nr:hypothetical protein B0H14DRAFT_3482370 [Mycena olivaceomarginata]
MLQTAACQLKTPPASQFPCSAPVATMHTGAPVVRRLTRNVCLPLSAYDVDADGCAGNACCLLPPPRPAQLSLPRLSGTSRGCTRICLLRQASPTPVLPAPQQIPLQGPTPVTAPTSVGYRPMEIRYSWTSGASSYLSSPCCAVLPYHCTRRCYYLLEDDQRRRTHVDPSTACWGFLWLGTRGDDSVPSTTSPSSSFHFLPTPEPILTLFFSAQDIRDGLASGSCTPGRGETNVAAVIHMQPQPFALVDLDRGVLRLAPSPAALRCFTHRKGRSSPVRAPPHNPRHPRAAPITRARPIPNRQRTPSAPSLRSPASRASPPPSPASRITHVHQPRRTAPLHRPALPADVTSSVSASPFIVYPPPRCTYARCPRHTHPL